MSGVPNHTSQLLPRHHGLWPARSAPGLYHDPVGVHHGGPSSSSDPRRCAAARWATGGPSAHPVVRLPRAADAISGGKIRAKSVIRRAGARTSTTACSAQAGRSRSGHHVLRPAASKTVERVSTFPRTPCQGADTCPARAARAIGLAAQDVGSHEPPASNFAAAARLPRGVRPAVSVSSSGVSLHGALVPRDDVTPQACAAEGYSIERIGEGCGHRTGASTRRK